MKNKKNKLLRLIIAGVEQSYKSKMMIILNIVLLVLAIGFVNFNAIKDIFTSEDDTSDIINVIIAEDDSNMFKEALSNNENINIVDSAIEDEENIIVSLIEDETKILKLIIESDEKVDINLYNEIIEDAEYIKQELFSENKNLTKEEIDSLLNDIEVERIINSVDSTLYDNYSFIIVIITFTIYLLFIFIASALASTIGMEKISKTTEYMLTGISEISYLWYNIVQVISVVIIQALLSFIYYLIANMINTLLVGVVVDADLSINMTTLFSSIDPTVISVIGYALFQIIISIFILSVIQAVITSKVTNMTDIGNSTLLVITVTIVASFVLPNIINDGEVVSGFIKLISILPILSCTMVPKLMLLGQISNILIILSIVISILALILVSVIGSKLFKRGLLNIQKSKKDNKDSKDKKEMTLEDRKFKNIISKIATAAILCVMISNTIPIILSVIFGILGLTSENANLILTIITFISYIYIPYLYLKTAFATVKSDNSVVSRISAKEAIKWVFIAICGITIFQYGITLIATATNITFTGVDADMLGTTGGILNNILIIISVAILPAIFEELLFRKGIITLTKKYGALFSIILSAVIFGLIHGNIIQAIFAFFTGLVLGYVYIKTNSIGVCMLIHFINNMFGALAIIMPTYEVQITMVMLFMAVIGLILLISNLTKFKQNFLIDNIDIVKVNKKYMLTSVSFIFMISFYLLMNVYVYVLMK